MTVFNTKSGGTSDRKLIVRAVRKLWRLAVDRPYRNMQWFHWRRPKGVFQPFSNTKLDRYPVIFHFVQKTLGAESAPTILSYGCSSGEEVFSLRRYLPRATIKGIDVNPGSIAVAGAKLKRTPDAAIAFETAKSTAAEPDAFYDAIFCMAVLRHGGLTRPGVTHCDHLIRFKDFAVAIEDFKRCLKPGGLLIIRHSNFRLCDTPAAAAFEMILRVKMPDNAEKTPVFGPDDRLMPGVEYRDTVFRKKRQGGPRG
jgi:2-polyprenyl-3-methyl-5-hydroxy-6-metoxy-1,4-benzoquinol methylase